MPLVNYCKKCKAEVPLGDSCPYCYGALSPNGEQISFGIVRVPVREWFVWNNILRVVLPVLVLVGGAVVLSEAASGGQAAVIGLIRQGFLPVMGGVLAFVLAAAWLILTLQGPENVHVLMDRQGLQIRTYLPEGRRLALAMRMMTQESAQKLAQEDRRPSLQGLVLVHRVMLPWSSVRRVRIWREGASLLFFRPSFWQAAAVHCPVQEMPAAEEFVRNKFRKSKKVRVIPPEMPSEHKKS